MFSDQIKVAKFQQPNPNKEIWVSLYYTEFSEDDLYFTVQVQLFNAKPTGSEKKFIHLKKPARFTKTKEALQYFNKQVEDIWQLI